MYVFVSFLITGWTYGYVTVFRASAFVGSELIGLAILFTIPPALFLYYFSQFSFFFCHVLNLLHYQEGLHQIGHQALKLQL